MAIALVLGAAALVGLTVLTGKKPPVGTGAMDKLPVSKEDEPLPVAAVPAVPAPLPKIDPILEVVVVLPAPLPPVMKFPVPDPVFIPAIIVPGEPEPVAGAWDLRIVSNLGQIMTSHGRVFTARALDANLKDMSFTIDMVFYRPDGSMVYNGDGARILLTPDVPGLWTVLIRAGGGAFPKAERDIPFRVHLYVPFEDGL